MACNLPRSDLEKTLADQALVIRKLRDGYRKALRELYSGADGQTLLRILDEHYPGTDGPDGTLFKDVFGSSCPR